MVSDPNARRSGSPEIRFRAGEPLMQELQNRVSHLLLSPDLVARRDLERYYQLLIQARRGMRFNWRELMLICDVCNGVLYEGWSMAGISADVIESMALDDDVEEGSYAAKWQVDADQLREKLEKLDRAQRFALADAVERFWAMPAARGGSFEDAVTAMGFASVPAPGDRRLYARFATGVYGGETDAPRIEIVIEHRGAIHVPAIWDAGMLPDLLAGHRPKSAEELCAAAGLTPWRGMREELDRTLAPAIVAMRDYLDGEKS